MTYCNDSKGARPRTPARKPADQSRNGASGVSKPARTLATRNRPG